MTLPSTRRPQFVEEELEKELEKEEKKCLVTTFNKVELFMKIMLEWYELLSPKQKSTLTLKKFKKRAVFELYNLKYEYHRLPSDWVNTLTENYKSKMKLLVSSLSEEKLKYLDLQMEMIFYKKVKKPIPARFRKNTNDPLKQIKRLDVKPRAAKSLYSRSVAACSSTGLLSPTCTSLIEIENGNKSDADSGISSSCEIAVPFSSKEDIKKKVTSEDDSVTKAQPKPKRLKTFIDLSNESPPNWWLKAYAEGRHLPRALTAYSGDGVNVIFYDYEPKFTEGDILKQNALTVHEATGFNWYLPTVSKPMSQSAVFELRQVPKESIATSDSD